jgi:tRNA(Arg) A34 adenosine deaminase TadA
MTDDSHDFTAFAIEGAPDHGWITLSEARRREGLTTDDTPMDLAAAILRGKDYDAAYHDDPPTPDDTRPPMAGDVVWAWRVWTNGDIVPSGWTRVTLDAGRTSHAALVAAEAVCKSLIENDGQWQYRLEEYRKAVMSVPPVPLRAALDGEPR